MRGTPTTQEAYTSTLGLGAVIDISPANLKSNLQWLYANGLNPHEYLQDAYRHPVMKLAARSDGG